MSVWTTKLRGPHGLLGPAIGLTLAAALAVAGPAQAAEQASQPAQAAKPSKQQNIGMVSGLTVGALAGGPFGAVIGAATGAVLGERYHKQSEEKATLAADLSQSQAASTQLEGDLAQTREQGAKLGMASRDLETSVGFRTGDSTLADEDIVRLQKVATLANAAGNVKVRVSGYADPRGSEQINTALSERRADAVAHVLIQGGVDASQLVVEAHGAADSKTAKGDLDGYAFDRRVTVKIEPSSNTKVAKN